MIRIGFAIGAALALIGCASASAPSAATANSTFWRDIIGGRYMEWDGRAVGVSGYIVAYAPKSVVLSFDRPKAQRDGSYDYDLSKCVTLLVSPDQFAKLRTGERATVVGEFGVRNLAPDETTVVTRPGLRDRSTSPNCTAPGWDALLLYVERLETPDP
jgi:hypothetical protein